MTNQIQEQQNEKPTFYKESLPGAEVFYVKNEEKENEVILVGMSIMFDDTLEWRLQRSREEKLASPKGGFKRGEMVTLAGQRSQVEPFYVSFGIDKPVPYEGECDCVIPADFHFDAKGKCTFATTQWGGEIKSRSLFNSRTVQGCQELISGIMVSWLEKEFGDNSGLGRKMVLQRARKFYDTFGNKEFSDYNIDLFKKELNALGA